MKSNITIENVSQGFFKNFVQNDFGTALNFAVTLDDNTTVVDLTAGTVTFKMNDSAGAAFLSETCTLDDAANGLCSYTLQAGDLDTVGSFTTELEVSAGGVTSTIKLGNLQVLAELL